MMLSVMFALLTCTYAAAQGPDSITGSVVDTDGNPLAGVYVSVKGTRVATSTDTNGNYSINVPSSSKTVVFSMLGMKDSEITVIPGKNTYDIIMESDALSLNEAVAVGYGTIIKKDLSSSVASVKGEVLQERAGAINLMQGMAGKLAGVNVHSGSGRPGGNVTIRVRGIGSISGSTDPLYVVDGVVGVDPNMLVSGDIASIDVLKDAAATSMYGAQGANGVVIITTNSGNKGGGTVTFDTKTGASILTRYIDVLNAQEYMDLMNRAYAYEGQIMPHRLNPEAYTYLFNYQKDAAGNYVLADDGYPIATPIYDTDWQREVYRPALITQNTLSYKGGNDHNTYYASLGYTNDVGLVRGTGKDHFTGTLNITSVINKWLDIQARISGSNETYQTGDDEGSFGYGIARYAMESIPIYPVRWPDGSYADMGYPRGPDTNPVQALEGHRNVNTTNYILTSIAGNIHFTKHLKLTVRADYQSTNYKTKAWAKKGLTSYTKTNNGYAEITNSQTRKWGNEDYLTYENTFFDDRLNSVFVLGTSLYSDTYQTSYAGTENYYDDWFDANNLAAGSILRNSTSGYDKKTMNSFYFRMNHSWNSKYMMGLTLRADGASNFGANNKYGFFPSASFAWNIYEEPFFDPVREVISHAKLRMSYGLVGNSGIGTYKTFKRYSPSSIYFNNQQEAATGLDSIGNPNLRWETTKQFDLGLDLSLLKDRIQLIADFYIKRSVDLLYTHDVPYSTGFSSIEDNVGELRNTGIEITLNTHNIDNRDFKWDTDIIFSGNNTICIDLGGTDLHLLGGMATSREGQVWGLWRLRQRLGTWGSDEAEEAARYGQNPGDYKWRDVNDDGKIDADDLVWWGRSVAPIEASLVNTFHWKGFTLMLDLGGRFGYWVHNRFAQQLDQMFGSTNGTAALLHSWTYENQNTMVPAIRLESSTNGGWVASDTYYMERGDFVRIRNINLSYDFKHSVLKNNKFIKELQLGVNVENPYVFTKYTGRDPEVSWLMESWDAYGIARPMVVTGNLRITF